MASSSPRRVPGLRGGPPRSLAVAARISSWALLWIGLAWLGAAAATCGEVQNFYRVLVRTPEEYHRVCQLGTLVVLAKAGEYVDIVAPDRVAQRLREEGRSVELVQADVEGAVRRMREAFSMGAYHTYAEMERFLEATARDHPDLAKLETIGTGCDTTRGAKSHRILALKLCRDVRRTVDHRPEVLVFGGIHAREITTTEMVLSLIGHLVSRRGRDPRVDFILDRRQVWFIPLLNPDGREYAMRTDIWWRKNRRRLDIGSAAGVDLNRNFSFGWASDGAQGGSSGDPYSSIYRGETPFSEPETQAFKEFVLAHRFMASLAFHSYGRYLIYPYGAAGRVAEDKRAFDEMAREMTRLNHYRFGDVRATVGYPSSGRHDDWLYGERNGRERTLAFEIEQGRSFFPEEGALPGLFAEVLHPSLVLMQRAGADLEVRPELADGGRRLTVSVANHGLQDAREVSIAVKTRGGLRVGGDRRVVNRIAGLLSRDKAPGMVSFSFPIRPDDREGPPREEPGLMLRVAYRDGEVVVHEYPISLPTD